MTMGEIFPAYDIVVVGGGHAGCEAAAAAANLGSKTLLITMDMTKFGNMSCNPAMGGIAKGQIVREIDALGGYSGMLTDKTTIQFRMLNKSKGPAMWSPRAQTDRMKYSENWRNTLENIDNLDLWQDIVVGLIIRENRVKGVITKIGLEITSRAVILTNGTFLNGLIHIGKSKMEGGRINESASYNLTEQLVGHGLITGRLKTGTPVRIDGRTINFSKLTEQKGDDDFNRFSFLPEMNRNLRQRSCWITSTNNEVHHILKQGFGDSPLYNGTIKSTGPRYCPSIESKLITFAVKESHQLFIEPEGESTHEYYLNGFSSSLPWDVQYRALKCIPGLENVKIYRPGYAIEYDFFLPTQLYHTLESKKIRGLFCAGQINGTTGYEEAGAQGIMAGINAHLNVHDKNRNFVLNRDEAYIGVLIDDLVTKGVDEPYRMFTSRAEYRILLRQDNADERLTRKSSEIGLAETRRLVLLGEKCQIRESIIDYLRKTNVKPQDINALLNKKLTPEISQPIRLVEILLRPQINLNDLLEHLEPLARFIGKHMNNQRLNEILQSAEIKIKYDGYISREKQLADKLQRLEHIDIENRFDYGSIATLSTEARQKLVMINPKSIGQASRIPGISPADINVLLILLGR